MHLIEKMQPSVFSPDLLGHLMYQLGESYERLMQHNDAACERRIACDIAADAKSDADFGGSIQQTHPDVARVRSLLRWECTRYL